MYFAYNIQPVVCIYLSLITVCKKNPTFYRLSSYRGPGDNFAIEAEPGSV